jgi:hypothetical protein
MSRVRLLSVILLFGIYVSLAGFADDGTGISPSALHPSCACAVTQGQYEVSDQASVYVDPQELARVVLPMADSGQRFALSTPQTESRTTCAASLTRSPPSARP